MYVIAPFMKKFTVCSKMSNAKEINVSKFLKNTAISEPHVDLANSMSK